MRTRPITLAHRLLIALGLPWAAVAAASIAMVAGAPTPIHDEMFLFAFLLTAALLAGSFLLWRRFVLWTIGRRVGTAGTSFVLLGHVLLWMPAWNAGCVTVDLLRLSQCNVVAGLWIVVTAYIWWGAGELAMHGSVKTMSPNARRLIYSFALIPFIPGLWGMAMIAFGQFVVSSDPPAGAVANAACALVVVAWWMVVWRASIFGSTGSAIATIVAAFTYIGLVTGSATFQWIVENLNGGEWATGLWVTVPLLLTGAWFAITPLLWPLGTAGGAWSTQDVDAAVACGRCGYSLVGLNATRCPECGHEEPLNAFVDRVMIQLRPDV